VFWRTWKLSIVEGGGIGDEAAHSTNATSRREEAAARWRRCREYGTRSDEEPLFERKKRKRQDIALCPSTLIHSCNISTIEHLYCCFTHRRSSHCSPPTPYHGSLISAPDLSTQSCRLPIFAASSSKTWPLRPPTLSADSPTILLYKGDSWQTLRRAWASPRFRHHNRAIPWSFNHCLLIFRRLMLAWTLNGNQMSTKSSSATRTTP
jgi:hypothetical protein